MFWIPTPQPPKSYYWGFSPENLEVDLIELDSKNKNFDKKIKMGPPGMLMVSIGFSLLSYKVVTSILDIKDTIIYLYLKVSLFLIFYFGAYIVYQGIFNQIKKGDFKSFIVGKEEV